MNGVLDSGMAFGYFEEGRNRSGVVVANGKVHKLKKLLTLERHQDVQVTEAIAADQWGRLWVRGNYVKSSLDSVNPKDFFLIPEQEK